MTDREKKLLIIAIILLIGLFGTKYFVLPTMGKLASIREDIQRAEYELEKTKLQLMSLDRYYNRLAEIKRENRFYEGFFYHGDPAAVRLEVLEFIDDLVRTLELGIESKEFFIEKQSRDNWNDQPEDGLYRLLYQAQIRGSYEQILSLLEALDGHEKYYSIGQLDIRKSADNTYLLVSIIIETYCIDAEEEKQL